MLVLSVSPASLQSLLPVPTASAHWKAAIWRQRVTTGRLPTLLIAGSLLGGRFLFHSLWKLWGVTNHQSLHYSVAQRLLCSYANERWQTIAVNDGSSRPDSHLYLRHKLLRVIGLTRGFNETGPQKSLQDPAKCTFLHVSLWKQQWALHSTTPQAGVVTYFLGLATVPRQSGVEALVQQISC